MYRLVTKFPTKFKSHLSLCLLFMLFSVLLIPLSANDECGSPRASSTLSTSNVTYDYYRNNADWNVGPNTTGTSNVTSRNFYFSVASAGSVTIELYNIDQNQANFSYSDSLCPTATLGVTTKTVTFVGPEDFNIKVFYVPGSHSSIEYGLKVTFTPSLSPSFSISNATVFEGNSGYSDMNFTVQLSQNANASVQYTTLNNTALSGSDYNLTSGTLTFTTGGSLTQTISVPIIGDTTIEPSETFTLTLSNPTGAILGASAATGTITNDDVLLSYCDDQNLSDGFHIANPFNDINKSIEIYCYNNKDYIALPIKNSSNNFVFNNNILANTNYYDVTNNTRTDFQAIEINAYTLKVETNSSIRLPQTISAPTSFLTMGSSFSNINLTGTPFAIDWSKTTISNCTQSKLRTAYYGQDVKINTLNYDSKAICNIDSMQLKLLDDYRYLVYNENEVLKKSCKTMAEAVPTSFLASSSIQGHYWISPFSNTRSYGSTNIKSDNRPIVSYCWYQTDLDWVWTFSLAMDGKVTSTKNDLVNKVDTCSEFGLVPFVPNKEDTFERVRTFLYDKKSQWVNYTGTINEKISVFKPGNTYYLSTEQSSIIWPYGSFGVYFPANGNNPKAWGAASNTTGWMSGSPMHNISTITQDYDRLNNDEGVTTRDYYSYGHYSNTDTTAAANQYAYTDTMGAKGWVSILGAADLNKTNEWFISRTGAGDNFNSTGNYPYYEPNGNYTAGAWLNFLFDSNGRVRHNDDWNNNYPYYDYMCMAEDNYDFTTRYGLIIGPFKAIEHNVVVGNELSNPDLKTKIVNDTLRFDIALLRDDLSALEADKNISVGIFLDDTYMVGSTETSRDLHYFGDIKMNGLGTFNALKTSGRFELPASSWPSGIQTWSSANKRLFFKFKYCSRSDYEWTQCWTPSGVTATCTLGQEAYCKTADSNDFALRPKNFDFSITGTSPYKAGFGYSTNFNAKDANNIATQNYNETIPLSYNETKAGCKTGNFDSNLTGMLFANGTKNIPSLSYSEVGVINIKMQETLGSEFALVDSSDTPDIERLITPYDQNWTYSPDHFAFTGSSFNNDSNGFTYLSTDLNISADLNLSIIAQTLGNTTTQNYNSACYSKITNYTLSYTPLSLSPSNALSAIHYLETNTSATGNIPINNTWSITSIPNTIFSTDNNGTGKLNIKVNFDRNSTKTVNPFNFITRDINVTDVDGVQGNNDLNQSTTFYYGRAHAPDYRFPNRDGNATIYYEVYCKDCNATFRNTMGIVGNESVNAINWYQNALHTNIAGAVTPVPQHSSDFLNTTTTHASPPVSTQQLTLKTSTAIPYVDKINLNSDSWLVHYPTDFTVTFYSSGSWAGSGFVKQNQPNATDTNTTVGEHIHKSAPARANKRITW